MAQTKQLTTELIMFKTKTNQLDRIKNLNLCANDLAEIDIVSQMSALEVLSLSVNSINTLKDISTCYNLKELYIRRNNVESLDEIEHLVSLRNLRIIWLAENPVALTPGYREHVIRRLPQLTKLDNVEISSEERQAAESQAQATQDVATRQDEQMRSMPQEEQSSEPIAKFTEHNSFAAAAKQRLGGRGDPEEETKQVLGNNPAAPEQRMNPNSTNPFFANKARSPDKTNRVGFANKNEIRRTPEPMIRLDKTPHNDEDQDPVSEMKQPALQKQITRPAQVPRKIADKPEKYDLGNNFIRKGSGLARTPPRHDDNSYSNSPIDKHEQEINMLRVDHNNVDNSDSPITWPSRAQATKNNQLSPIVGLRMGQQAPAQASQQNSAQPGSGRITDLQAQQQQVQMQGKQSSPQLMVPRQIRSPQHHASPQAQAAQLQNMAAGGGNFISATGVPSIAIPQNLSDPAQLQQIMQLNQLLLQQHNQQQQQQQQPSGFSNLVQQQTQAMAGVKHQSKEQQKHGDKQAAGVGGSKKPSSSHQQQRKGRGGQGGGQSEHPYRRDENILCAILALLKELDKNGLEFVIKDCNKRIAKMDNFQ